MWGRGSEADFQVSLAGRRADALCPPSCQRRKTALFFEAPPKPAGPGCSGVTVGTLDRVSSGRIWVSSGNWGTNTTSPQPRMAGLVHGDPMPRRGWQRRDLTLPGQTMPPVSAAYSPLLSPGSGDESPAQVLSPQGKGGNRFCCVWTSAQQRGTTLELGPTLSQKARNPASVPQVNFSPKSHPHSVSQCLLGRVPRAPSCSIRLSRSQHFCYDIVIKPYKLLPRWEEEYNTCHRLHCASCYTYVMSVIPPHDF